MKSKIATGAWGEAKACKHLTSLGYCIIETNWRCPAGELDVIAMDGSTLVFVEVRTRSSRALGLAVETIDRRKRERLSRLANWYMAANGIVDVQCRFDVVAITRTSTGRYELDLIKDAFSMT